MDGDGGVVRCVDGGNRETDVGCVDGDGGIGVGNEGMFEELITETLLPLLC